MKNKFILYTCFLTLINSFYSCSIDDITTDKVTGEEKSFLMINNSIIKTTFQIRLFDDVTNALITKPMVVGIASNKKLVDLKGIYTNKFITNNGIVNFGIDPNYAISITDTLKLNIVSTNENGEYMPIIKKINLARVTNKIVVLYHSASTRNAIASNSDKANLGIKANVASGTSPTYISLNGQKYGNPNYAVWNLNWLLKPQNDDDNWYNWYQKSSAGPFTSDIVAEVKFFDELDKNTRTGSIAVYYDDLRSEIQYTDGTYETWKNDIKTTGNNSRKGYLTIPANSYILYLGEGSVKTNSDLNFCTAGFNFSFAGIDATAKPEFAYKTSRTTLEGKTYTQTIGLAQPTKDNPVYNTDELYYGNNKNTVEFADNLQYAISPNKLDLGGKDACGKTYNFQVTPIVGLSKYKLIISASCSGKNISITPSLMLLYKKSGSANSGGLTFVNGAATVYLADKTNYDITGSFNNNNINFSFTTNLSNTAAMRQASLNSNADLKEVYFTNDASDPLKQKVTLVYKENACPF